MVDDRQIDEWLKDGVISEKQARQMRADVQTAKQEASSNKFVIALSTIGSLLLGIGAVLFIASNWDSIPDLVKVLLLLAATFGAYYAGYVLAYQKQNLPKVGNALFFLGALLFGASIFLIAQIYNVNANAHSLVLLWLIGILPLVYAFVSVPLAVLATALALIWSVLFEVEHRSFDVIAGLPFLLLSAGILLFSIGALHYASERYQPVGRAYRIVGIKIAMLAAFVLTFKGFHEMWAYTSREGNTTSVMFIVFTLLALVGAVVNWFLNPGKVKTSSIENPAALIILGLALIAYFAPAPAPSYDYYNTAAYESSRQMTETMATIYAVIFNLVFAGLIIILLKKGYDNHDMSLVNTAMFWLGALILVRYFDFFWELLETSLFFMIGGIILLVGGIALEKKRREIKAEIRSQ
jgi:uncharacterized membrane protein